MSGVDSSPYWEGGEAALRSWHADLALLGVALVWGATFVMVKEVVAHFPVFAFLTLRFACAFLVSIPLLWVRARRCVEVGRAELVAGGVVGLALLAGYGFQTAGLRYTTAAKAGFITGLSVVFVPLLGALLWRRRPPVSVQAGVVLATVGLMFLTGGADVSVARGDVLILGCALAFALHIVAVGLFAPRVEPRLLAVVQIGTVALLSALVSRVVEWPWPFLSWSVAWAAFFTGVVATALALGVQSVAQRFTTATHTALIFAMEPVFAACFAFALAGERLGLLRWLGCALILVGMLIAEVGLAPGAPLRWLRSGMGKWAMQEEKKTS